MEMADRFWAKVDEDGECWTWTAHRDRYGYGMFSIKGRPVLAHRWSYEHLIGAIPEGLVIDHLCRNRACVNPWHMEPTTQKVNALRGEGVGARSAQVTKCPHGHPYDEMNTYLYRGERRCKACRSISDARWYARRKLNPNEKEDA